MIKKLENVYTERDGKLKLHFSVLKLIYTVTELYMYLVKRFIFKKKNVRTIHWLLPLLVLHPMAVLNIQPNVVHDLLVPYYQISS